MTVVEAQALGPENPENSCTLRYQSTSPKASTLGKTTTAVCVPSPSEPAHLLSTAEAECVGKKVGLGEGAELGAVVGTGVGLGVGGLEGRPDVGAELGATSGLEDVPSKQGCRLALCWKPG